MKRLALVLAILLGWLTFSAPLGAQGALKVTSAKFSNSFPTRMTFSLEAESTVPITQAILFVEFEGTVSRNRYTPDFKSDTKIQTTHEWRFATNYVPPGVLGQYWWTLQDSAGNQLETPKQNFRVDDPRFTWKKQSNDKLALYWYQGNDNFGKAVFDRAMQAMDMLQRDTGVPIDNQVQILIYGDRPAFLEALGPSAKGTEGGVTFSNFVNGVVLMNFDLNELEWGKGATTHEMTHVIMHQRINSALGNSSFPTWLDEGLAMYYETNPGTLDRQFSTPLQRAIQGDTVYRLKTLSGYFASTSSAQNLAYGQAYSVVEFMFRRFGRDKIAQLLQAVKVGGVDEDIFKQVLGLGIDQLDNEWRKDQGLKPRDIAVQSSATPTAFPTFSLSSDPNPPPTVAKSSATATPQVVAIAATPVPAPTAAPKAPANSNPLSSLCGGVFGFIALGLFGATWTWRRLHKTIL